MKTLLNLSFIWLLPFLFSNDLYASKSLQRAASNIWIQQQQNSNPSVLSFITLIHKNAQKQHLQINKISSNLTSIIVNATARKKINLQYFQRALTTTLLFDSIKITKIKNKNNRLHANLKIIISKTLKRNSYAKATQIISQSQTQVRYLINDLISKMQSKGQLTRFCPSTPLKLAPKRVGSKVKLVIYSYQLIFSGNYKNIKIILKSLESNRQYISLHHLTLRAKKSNYLLKADLRFYHIAIRRNNREKSHVFERVVADKICTK